MGYCRLCRKVWRRFKRSCLATIELFKKPLISFPQEQTDKTKQHAQHRNAHTVSLASVATSKLTKCLFPNLPEHYPLKKKLQLARNNTCVGVCWDILQVLLSIVGCVLYVVETYLTGYDHKRIFWITELFITQFFLLDFLFSAAIATSLQKYFCTPLTWVDIAIILPVFLSIGLERANYAKYFAILRFLRVLRVARILRTFRTTINYSGIKRQIMQLSLTLLCLVFIAAGVVNVMENDVKQSTELNCRYISELTDWEPSCAANAPASIDCDCSENNCGTDYVYGDKRGQPHGIRCNMMSFFDCFYFIVVTVATVGYGDFHPTTQLSRFVVIMFIITSLVLIPMQVNQLIVLLQASSAYRNSFYPKDDEEHIILCGHVNDRPKMERFLKEFFHPDRSFSQDSEYHAVLLSNTDPTEDMISLLNSAAFETRVTFLIGSALSTEDLKRVRADVACAMFFLCNTEVPDNIATVDDAATVLRTLSVSNFNPDLELLVQVLKPEDRDILKDSEVDVILCLDEFKTSLQARNALCPGYSTLIENLFHTFGNNSNTNAANKHDNEDSNATSWTVEYLHGAHMEVYYIPLSRVYMEQLSYQWTLVCEGIYLEYDVMLIGVCSGTDHTVCLNPSPQEMVKYTYPSKFFTTFNVGILIADEQALANAIAAGMLEVSTINRIIEKLLLAEMNFGCRKKTVPEEAELGDDNNDADGNAGAQSPPHLGGSPQSSSRKGLGNMKHQLSKQLSRVMSTKFNVNRATIIPGPLLKNNSSVKQLSIKDLIRANKSRATIVAESMKNQKLKMQTPTPPRLGQGVNRLLMSHSPSTSSADTTPIRTIPNVGVAQINASLRGLISQPSISGISDIRASKVLPPSKVLIGEVLVEEEEEEDDEADNDTATTISNNNNKKEEYNNDEERSVESSIGGSMVPPSRTHPETTEDAHKNIKHLAHTPSGKSNPVWMDSFRGSGISRAKSSLPRDTLVDESNKVDDDDVTSPALATMMIPMSNAKISQFNSRTLGPGEIEDANHLKNHIIVFGCTTNLGIFIQEFRRALMIGESHHPLVVVDEKMPHRWERLLSHFIDIHYLHGKVTHSADFNRINARKAFAIVQLASRDSVTTVEGENLDSDTLFSYLKLEKHIPSNVFFTVELTCITNMAVLNSTIVRRSRNALLKSTDNKIREAIEQGAANSRPRTQSEEDKIDDQNKENGGAGYSSDASTQSAGSTYRQRMVRAHQLAAVGGVAKRGTFASTNRNRRSMIGGNTQNNGVSAPLLNNEPQQSQVYNNSEYRRRRAPVNAGTAGERFFRAAALLPLRLSFAGGNRKQTIDIDTSVVRRRKTNKKSSFLSNTFLGSRSARRSTMDSQSNSGASSDSGANSSTGYSSGSSGNSRKRRYDFANNNDPNSSDGEDSSTDRMSGNTEHRKKFDGRSSLNANAETEEAFDAKEVSYTNSFWGTSDTHHTLPVFASGRAFVPSTFDSVLCQSFFGVLTPILTEKLVCGQKHQTMYQISVPDIFKGRCFVDCFRAFLSRNILVIGIYRYPSILDRAVLPYVYTCPKPETIMRDRDKLFIFCNPIVLSKVIEAFKKPIVYYDLLNSYCLGDVASGEYTSADVMMG